MTKKFSDIVQAFLKAVGIIKDGQIDVGKQLKELKAIRERLELAKQQQSETIAGAECTKLDNDVDKQEAIREIEAEYEELNKLEDAKIEEAEGIIEEADEWLSMFPSKK